MSTNNRKPNSDKTNLAMGNKLWIAAQETKNLLNSKPELSKDRDIRFLKVFGEVVSEVGLLFKNGDVEQKLKELLLPLSSYTLLMPYFLLMKSILDDLRRVMEVDMKEHKDRLEWVNKQMIRIAVEATAIAQNLEELGMSLIDIMRGEDSKKAENLIIFDIHCHRISFSLASCISDMELVKCTIDEGFHSIKAFKTKTLMICTGACAIAAAIIAPVAVGYLGLIAAYGIMDMIGVGTVAALSVAGVAACPMYKANKTANKIKKYYNDQECNWQQLDEKLKTMKEELNRLREARKNALPIT